MFAVEHCREGGSGRTVTGAEDTTASADSCTFVHGEKFTFLREPRLEDGADAGESSGVLVGSVKEGNCTVRRFLDDVVGGEGGRTAGTDILSSGHKSMFVMTIECRDRHGPACCNDAWKGMKTSKTFLDPVPAHYIQEMDGIRVSKGERATRLG